jgi:hypothetical protein
VNPISAARHVSRQWDDLAYEAGDPKAPGFLDALTDAAEEARS